MVLILSLTTRKWLTHPLTRSLELTRTQAHLLSLSPLPTTRGLMRVERFIGYITNRSQLLKKSKGEESQPSPHSNSNRKRSSKKKTLSEYDIYSTIGTHLIQLVPREPYSNSPYGNEYKWRKRTVDYR